MSSTARTMKETSGSLVLVSGVGTQTLMTSIAASSPKSVVAEIWPLARRRATSLPGTSSM